MEPQFADAEALRQFMLEQPEGAITRTLMLLAGAVFLFTVVELVRRGRLGEEQTPLWVAAAVCAMALGVWFDGVRLLAHAMGAWTASSALFFLATLFLVFICLSYAVRLSALARKVRRLAQELALLRAEHDGRASRPEDRRVGEP